MKQPTTRKLVLYIPILAFTAWGCHQVGLPDEADDSNTAIFDSASEFPAHTTDVADSQLPDYETASQTATDTATVETDTLDTSDISDTGEVLIDTEFYVGRARCGDGIRNQEWEVCDDGNLAPGDGANGSCAVEPNFICDTDAEPCTCGPAIVCGNGKLEPGEICDDGNTNDDDGCDATCSVIECGWECGEDFPLLMYACGNGLIESGESCEDGNTESDDGCSADCQVEPGWECPIPLHSCTPLPRCGDGLTRYDLGERCDDANTESDDGCSADCLSVEKGFDCPVTGGPCTFVVSECGNAIQEWDETCDDGNITGSDGCSAECAVETGYECPWPGVPCIAVCGDGIVTAGEACDDGNDNDSDDCDSHCAFTDETACKHMVDTDGAETAECIVSVCGNSVVEPGEQCDFGDKNSDAAYNGCTTQCAVGPHCGDGIINGEEGCDDGVNGTVYGDGDSDSCTPNCQLPAYCGDGIFQPQYGEQCDAGAGASSYGHDYGGCTAKCKMASFCGDGRINPEYEICDIAGTHVSSDGKGIYACLDCKEAPRCGDGIVQSEWGEDCDGAPVDGKDCNDECRFAGFCGDGVVDKIAGEQCDYGPDDNDGSYGGCTAGCLFSPRCGDGKVQEDEGEECDAGDARNLGNYGECGPNCKMGPHCGDGIVQSPYEECDEGFDTLTDGRGGDTCTDSCVRFACCD
ncbi:MAG: DUF4215 domain-containing protein [Deltaproteobacteria bacterium]|nr:DUF4215 domain-containing protein [Deltaproteobacteria bacterium]